MKKTYKIEVDCANCANLMEAAVRRIAGVDDASVSYMTGKLTVTFSEGADVDEVMARIVKACRKVEPDSVIYV